MKELLKKLCMCNGIPGFEDEVRELIRAEVEPYADKIEVDPMGSLYVFKKGRKTPKYTRMVTAHMDEVGFMVRSVTEDGYLKLAAAGGIDPRVVVGRRVLIGDKLIHGVAGLRAIHLTSAEERKVAPGMDDLYIDIGADSKEEAEEMVSIADPIYFDSEFIQFGDGRVKAKAIDDRIGCAVMTRLVKEEPEYDTWFVWLVGEEIGGRGARVAAQRINPGICLNLEGTSAGDLPGVPAHIRACQLGKGPAISLMDGKTVYTRRIIKELTAAADKAGVTWQYRLSANAGNDAGPIPQANGGCEICTISAPIRYMHSACNVAAWSDLEAMEQLARIFVNEVSDRV